MKKLLATALLGAGSLLSGCITSCPAYDSNYRYERPRYKPTFKKDHGHQKNKYAEAANKAKEQTRDKLFVTSSQDNVNGKY